MAVYTIILSFDFRVIIAFDIEGLGHPKHISGAVFDTELAALAPLLDYRYPTLRDLNGLQVKWNTPILHLRIPLALPDLEEKISPTIPDREGWKARYKFLLNLTGNPEFGKFNNKETA
jgi:hypothetical protein